MEIFTGIAQTTLHGFIIVLVTSLLIGLIFVYLHKKQQKLTYKKKKTWNFNDSSYNKILTWLKRNIFGIFAFIFLFSALMICIMLMTNIFH